ncbi:hypothetical protein D3C86_1957250 [compost metagenome]
MARVVLGNDIQALLDEHLGHLGNRRAYHVIHEAVHLIARREMHRVAQTLTPATTPTARVGEGCQGMHLRNLALGLQVKRLVQAPHHGQENHRERQRGKHHR